MSNFELICLIRLEIPLTYGTVTDLVFVSIFQQKTSIVFLVFRVIWLRGIVSWLGDVDVDVIHSAIPKCTDIRILLGTALLLPVMKLGGRPAQLVPYPCDVILANPLSLIVNIFIYASVYLRFQADHLFVQLPNGYYVLN